MKKLVFLILGLVSMISVAHATPTPTVGSAACGYNATFVSGSDSISGTINVGSGNAAMQCVIMLAPVGFWVSEPTCTPDLSSNGVPLWPLTYTDGHGNMYLDYAADDTLLSGDTISYTCTGSHN